MLTFRVEGFHFHVLPMRTRFPFRYGIASLDWLPHVVVTVDLVVAGKLHRGMTAEGLPPKWFTKNPETVFEVDLAEMIAVIQNAARIGKNAGQAEESFTGWWRAVQEEQQSWSARRGLPPLLAGLGVSVVERAVLDGLCRATGKPLHELLRAGELVEDLGWVRAGLAGISPGQVLPAAPRRSVVARHTVGLGDWLSEADVPEAERPEDGLPVSLQACISEYALTSFKIKVGGNLESDRERLRRVFEIVNQHAPADWYCTLDGNEAFFEMADFREYYEALASESGLREGLKRVLFVEQPLRREVCLAAEVGNLLEKWEDAPRLLLDEGDGDLSALPEALRLGYSGVSHKNCKGILKGVANLALIQQANAVDGGARLVSGEDLANVGPVALNQDLAVQALLGVAHVERNGHHYFRGLSMWPPFVQEAVLAAHGDLFRRHERGFATLAVQRGELVLESVNAAPFGCGLGLDWVENLEPLAAWIRRGGLSD
jgi:hypothetical protein